MGIGAFSELVSNCKLIEAVRNFSNRDQFALFLCCMYVCQAPLKPIAPPSDSRKDPSANPVPTALSSRRASMMHSSRANAPSGLSTASVGSIDTTTNNTGSTVSLLAASNSSKLLSDAASALDEMSVATAEILNTRNTHAASNSNKAAASASSKRKASMATGGVAGGGFGAALVDQFNRTDVDMVFISNCITGPKHECNGKRFLNRFQFMDALIGLAQ
jgi:hypothetical protein